MQLLILEAFLPYLKALWLFYHAYHAFYGHGDGHRDPRDRDACGASYQT